jgi:hypothetical protein
MLSYSIKLWMWYSKSIQGVDKGRKLLGEEIRSFQDKKTRIQNIPFDSALSELISILSRMVNQTSLGEHGAKMKVFGETRSENEQNNTTAVIRWCL